MFVSIGSRISLFARIAAFATTVPAALLLYPLSTNASEAPEYTGVVIDARDFSEINRSPAPVIYGPAPENEALYPDTHHVPTPDEVQDQSVVRYYHTENEAETTLVGNHPLVIHPDELAGPGHDSVRLNATSAEQLKSLDKSLHFTRNWKVAFLVPEGR